MHDITWHFEGKAFGAFFAYQMYRIIEFLRARHAIHTYLRLEAQVVAEQTTAEKQIQLEEAPAGDISDTIDVH